LTKVKYLCAFTSELERDNTKPKLRERSWEIFRLIFSFI